MFITNSNLRADRAIVVTKKIRPKCDRSRTRPGRQERFRLPPMRNPTWLWCDARTAIVDVSESNHEGFRKTDGTPASSKCAAAIDVNHLLYLQNFPERIACNNRAPSSDQAASANARRPSLEAIRPIRRRDRRSDARNCAMTRRSTCRCAGFVARRRRREMWRKPAGSHHRGFRR